MEGDTVNLTCNSTGIYYVNSYIWYKRSGSEDIQIGYEQNYTITNINITDNSYKCWASSYWYESQMSDYKTLEVFYSPKNVRVSISPSAGIMEGGSVTLTCSGVANPRVDKYIWFKRSGTVDVEVGYEQSYTITNIAITDNNYKCRASNQHGSAFSDYKTLEVFYSPKNVQVSISPSAGTVEGGSVTLTCSGDANPRVGKYTWFKRSGTVDIVVGYEQRYTITNIAITDHNYKCRASNQHSSAFSDYKTLEVFYRPKNVRVSISPSAGIVEGDSVTLTCSGDANPRVGSYTWFKRSGTVDVEVGYEQRYTITNIAITDNNYKCRASNQHGSAFSDYKTFDVFYSPKNVRVSISPSAGIMEGDSVTLTCSGDANPRVGSYTWFKRSGTEDVEVGYEQSYTISNIAITDNYRCRADNQHGSAFSDYKTPNVLYSPKKASVSVTLICRANGNPPVKYTWFKEGESTPVAHQPSYSITNISKEDVARFYCKAGNAISHQYAVSQPVTCVEECPKAQVAAAGLGGFCGGLITATLFYVLWMGRKKLKMTFGKEARESRRKWGKKTTVEDDYENVDPESKDDTYTTLNTKTGLGNDVYETLTTRNSSTYATTQV
ncbi:B-cell receptor CD22-like [Salminus brasiliensis]|uniref:B-cell receptor CD22-like n=1 Tax=Salminus brasiliensis TaxID=930266 RepID=UPI003B839E66